MERRGCVRAGRGPEALLAPLCLFPSCLASLSAHRGGENVNDVNQRKGSLKKSTAPCKFRTGFSVRRVTPCGGLAWRLAVVSQIILAHILSVC